MKSAPVAWSRELAQSWIAVDDKTEPFHWREQATRLTIIATRPAKRVPWFLRAEGAGCSGSLCLHSLLPTGKTSVTRGCWRLR
jgi:hypothetical protein